MEGAGRGDAERKVGTERRAQTLIGLGGASMVSSWPVNQSWMESDWVKVGVPAWVEWRRSGGSAGCDGDGSAWTKTRRSHLRNAPSLLIRGAPDANVKD